VRCRLCGEWFPDNDAVWDHDCPVIAADVKEFHRRVRPTLPQYRSIAHHVDRAGRPGDAHRRDREDAEPAAG
jgi:hypothetical protein